MLQTKKLVRLYLISLFSLILSQIIVSKASAYPTFQALYSNVPTNIWLGWKSLSNTNTLAYYETS